MITKTILAILFICTSLHVNAQMDPNPAQTTVTCAAYLKLGADIFGSKNNAGFLDSRPYWKGDNNWLNDPPQAEKNRQLEIKAIALARFYIRNIDPNRLIPYYYDLYALEMQQEMNMSSVRGQNKLNNGYSYCLRSLEVIEIMIRKGIPPLIKNSDWMIPAINYTSRDSIEAKKKLKEFRKVIPFGQDPDGTPRGR